MEDAQLGMHHQILGREGGGQLDEIVKKCLSPQKSEKKFVKNVGRKKSLLTELMTKYVHKHKPEIENVQNREGIRQNT